MGKPPPSATKLRDLAKVTSEKIGSSKFHKPRSKARISSEFVKPMEDPDRRNRVPLAAMVSSCVRRWFQDTLKEAKAGDFGMQVLVGQMYYSGYGVPRDVNKGRIWITRASKARASVWRVSNKHPGYNASDSDSDELKGDSK
ncbi:Sel1-like protein [Cinnamomum micranthum f. kanehirae]|uniref:Sel1-like protein n=1 Tax=Cinnamomum micranthum f. kanehirae TaxID=337451 RepID=A0A443NKC7_9MAGN|nr:Sel1-like protein [Cinnamomum micranthum f. kanehirae]